MEDHQVIAMMAATLLASSQSGGGFESERAQLEVVDIAHEIFEMAKRKVEKGGD